jgi:glycosyltransferase involved in cell wall biosynthesis
MRLAWFSPVPPVRSGVAGRSVELVAALRQRGHQIDIYVDAPPTQEMAGVRSAHDFIWQHQQRPYDLVVYLFGNSSVHDYAWPYALRYPGLVVLHDTHLHHARAALLLREKRIADYRVEFAWNHPDVSRDLAEVAVAGFDSALYYNWTMVRALVESSRLTAAHGLGAVAQLHDAMPALHDRIVSIRLGEGDPVTSDRAEEARRVIRTRHSIPEDAVLFGCFGGLTPEKRLAQIFDALRTVIPYAPGIRLLLGGAPAAHYDVAAEIRARHLQDRVTLTGYLETDADLTDHLAACDVSLNLRWPTARETSGPWLRALAAGRPTIITDLAHLGDVPSLDPRTWRANFVGIRHPVPGIREGNGATRPSSDSPGAADRTADPAYRIPSPADRIPDPVCIAIDILDEDHSLGLAMRRLATDQALRARLGRAGYSWWTREHAVDVMVNDYERAIVEAAAQPAPAVALPYHMRDDGREWLRALSAPFDVAKALSGCGLLE